MKGDFLISNELFSFDILKCARSDYYHNNCTECIDICPEQAFFYDREKLKLDIKKCVDCGVCLGGCPTEALTSTRFNPNSFAQHHTQEHLSCKSSTPCLAVFDSEHLIAMALQQPTLSCDLSHCERCEFQNATAIKVEIQTRIDEANLFLKPFNKAITQASEPERRGFFNKLRLNVQEKTSLSKAEVLQKALKESLEESLVFQKPLSFTTNKRINTNCINCSECIEFCPTNALFYNSEATKIYFSIAKCIHCGICNAICKEGAIENETPFDMLDFAFKRAHELIAFDMKICKECRTPFPYIAGEQVCKRCQSYLTTHSDMFKMAFEE